MKITIIAVGKIREKYWKDAIAEYEKRLSRFCKLQIIEVTDEKAPEALSEHEKELILQKEGQRILSCIPSDSYVISMAIEGVKYDSPGFAEMIRKQSLKGYSHFCFLIGGSLGLMNAVKKQSNSQISFSDLTFPHQLMRVILLEQIYRSFKINSHEPYHK